MTDDALRFVLAFDGVATLSSPPATILTERTQLFDLMGELKLYGISAGRFDRREVRR